MKFLLGLLATLGCAQMSPNNPMMNYLMMSRITDSEMAKKMMLLSPSLFGQNVDQVKFSDTRSYFLGY